MSRELPVTLDPKRLHILQHALGIDEYGRGASYRNHYVIGEECDGYDDCRALAEAGLMVEHPPRALFGGMSFGEWIRRGYA